MYFNRFIALLFALALCCALCVPVFAADDEAALSDEAADSVPVAVETVTDDKQVVFNVVMPSGDSSAAETSEDSSVGAESVDGAAYSTYALNAAAAPSESSIPAVLVSLFGEYQPRTQTVTEHLADGSTVEYTQIVDGVAGIDWTWIASVSLFAMFLYCLLRMIGGCLRWI